MTTFTPDASLDLLFDPTLLNHASITLPPEFHLRPLSLTDHTRNHLNLLSNLTLSPQIPPKEYESHFNSMKSCPSTYFIIVIVNKQTDELIACGSLVLEKKFIRGLGLVGHLEDITVDKLSQGKGLGKLLITVLAQLSKDLGAYKCILDCDPKNEEFYIKCGFENKGFEMAQYV